MHSIKRLHNEITEFYKTHHDFTVVYKKLEIDFLILGRLKFVLGQHYPFRAPTLYLLKKNVPHGINYIHSLKSPSLRILKYLEYLYDGCMCCNTILNHVNWSPTYHIEKILQEIKIYNDMKRVVKYHLVLDDILWKYLEYIVDSHIANYCITMQMGLTSNIKMHIISFLDSNSYFYRNLRSSLCVFHTQSKMTSMGFTRIL